jgi:acetolactate synthase-1/2/3 large subunit
VAARVREPVRFAESSPAAADPAHDTFNDSANDSAGGSAFAPTLAAILDELDRAHRPVILAGSGVRIAGAGDALLALAERLEVPVVTAWTHDIFPNDHRLYAGRPGTIGTRAGNFVVQNADLVIVLGSRLNIRQVSYNASSFARHARKVWVDIDPAEFRKPFVQADLEITADLKVFMPALTAAASAAGWTPCHARWVEWCATINECFTPMPDDYPLSDHGINAYHFMAALFDRLAEGDVVVCGDATATIVPWQIGRLKAGMRLVSNSGSASMGYDIPAALGAAVALARTHAALAVWRWRRLEADFAMAEAETLYAEVRTER